MTTTTEQKFPSTPSGVASWLEGLSELVKDFNQSSALSKSAFYINNYPILLGRLESLHEIIKEMTLSNTQSLSLMHTLNETNRLLNEKLHEMEKKKV